jgi:hypothetical protein
MSSDFVESHHVYQYTFIVYDHVASCTPHPSTGLPQGLSGPTIVDTSISYEVSYVLVCPFCMSSRSRRLPSSRRSAPPSRSSGSSASQVKVSIPVETGRAQMRETRTHGVASVRRLPFRPLSSSISRPRSSPLLVAPETERGKQDPCNDDSDQSADYTSDDGADVLPSRRAGDARIVRRGRSGRAEQFAPSAVRVPASSAPCGQLGDSVGFQGVDKGLEGDLGLATAEQGDGVEWIVGSDVVVGLGATVSAVKFGRDAVSFPGINCLVDARLAT